MPNRQAASAPVLARGQGVVYRELPCRSLLNRSTSRRMPFTWTINPYRGCEFGCRYCYARYTHEFMGLEDPHLFETEIFAKTNASDALARDLARLKDPGSGIAMGTATDPYQPAERKALVTRGILELLARSEDARGIRFSITTKSDLVTRDLDVLREIGRRMRLSVNITITTLNRRLSRILEPRAPRPGRRLLAVKALAEAGIRTGVFIMPVLPGITDRPASLEAIASAASRAGASTIAHQVLFLMSSAKRSFYPFLSERFPRLLAGYRRTYALSAYNTAAYRKRIDLLMESLRKRYDLDGRSDPDRAPGRRPDLQMSLAFRE